MTTIPSPDLDPRDFDALVAQALEVVSRGQSPWTDFSAGDPGVVLLEAFAYLTDVLLYRLNRVPEKAHRELLQLLAMAPHPSAASLVEVALTAEGAEQPITVDAGTVVVAQGDGGTAVEFLTDSAVILTADTPTATVVARNCTQVTAEALGVSTGRPGQRFQLAKAPVVRPTGADRDLLIGVEVDARSLDRQYGIEVDGRSFEMWTIVSSFATAGHDDRSVMVDRYSGAVVFAPAVIQPDGDGSSTRPLAAVPPEGAQIRAWYRCGGGAAGNVAAGTIGELRHPQAGSITVTNPTRAVGGRDAETIDAALERATAVIHEPRRAITADDFEALATGNGAVSRALALTAAERWVHATPGSVEVHLVPNELNLGPSADPEAATLDLAPTGGAGRKVVDDVRDQISARQPLGTSCKVLWARYKRVSVSLTVAIAAGEDPDVIRQRVTRRIDDTINPLPRKGHAGWPFGQALRASNIYDAALREPGVRFAEAVTIEVDDAPDDRPVAALAADHHQPNTWYAAVDDMLFRSEDDGSGWEAIWQVPNGTIRRVVAAPDKPGALAVLTRHSSDENTSSALHVSDDCGTTFGAGPVATISWKNNEAPQAINDVCWLPPGHPFELLLATDAGLFIDTRTDDQPPRPVDGAPAGAYWTVAAAAHSASEATFVAGLKQEGGIIVGRDGRFAAPTMTGTDVRRIVVEQRGPRTFLWAAVSVEGADEGQGCARAELVEAGPSPLSWTMLNSGWRGGSCRDLVVTSHGIAAGTEFGGVLTRRDADPATPWQPSALDCGLPLRDDGQGFQPVSSVAGAQRRVMVGTNTGVFTPDQTDGGRVEFTRIGQRASSEIITIPRSWLLVGGTHAVTIRGDR